MITNLQGDVLQVPRSPDDVRAIRQDCKSLRQWQAQLLVSLCDSGWTLNMLVWVPASDPGHWFEILTRERLERWQKFDPAFEIDSASAAAAIAYCERNRERWLHLLLRTLVDRGWTRTMLAEALAVPRTNIIRRLDAAGAGSISSETDEIEA